MKLEITTKKKNKIHIFIFAVGVNGTHGINISIANTVMKIEEQQ